MNTTTPFKEGDWIIATRPRVWTDDVGLFNSQPVTRQDRSFLSEPVKILAITEAHVVLEIYYSKSMVTKSILALTELDERQFIIAAKPLIDVVMSRMK